MIVFRVDASLQMGSGHVMRCLTLARILRDHGQVSRFVCREHPGNLISHIRDQGFDVAVLPMAKPSSIKEAESNPHASWLGDDWQADAQATERALSGAHIDWLVVDHYALDARWHDRMRKLSPRLMVIDDLADRPYGADLLLDQNLNRKAADYEGHVADNCQLLIGPLYALLRPEFAKLRAESLERRANAGIAHVLVSLGGVDKDNFTTEVLKALQALGLPSSTKISVVMGQNAPWIEAVRAEASKMQNTEVMVNVQNMASLMAMSDVAIGAAGSTAWERCTLGLPSLMLVLADNQRGIAEALSQAGAAMILDHKQLAHDLARKWQLLDAVKRAEMTAISAQVADGEGGLRVMREMLDA